MKIISSKFLMVFFLLFNMATALAGPPPSPPRKGPPLPPVPIDENLVLLLVGALSFGIYSIYKYKLKQKTPA
ncbi:hypothetical protein [Flavobacterium hydatis]|uniref:Signal peptidase n=1 Tax=Flavobacterium hydatis TaxID=991 RepID=A0A086AUF4_FLAHY|nr:hypothetical protein [Flavobacterium hydatis]KFF20318.1 hypothetical protein IW20_00740 [Flavobacterium hydatis]OXA98391.1 hypothetical protein B0A62_00915 [Flavobacterium hydatis]